MILVYMTGLYQNTMKNSLLAILVICCCFATIFKGYGQNSVTPNQLLKECQSLDALIISKNTKKLKTFTRSEFDKSARQNLTKLLQADPPHQNKLIKLAGFLDMREWLTIMLSQKKLSKSTKQVIKLALVRTGDEAKLTNLMKNAKKLPVDDDFVFRALPMLIYARQKIITDYLLEIVLSDEKHCTPADAETPGNINCAYRIVEALAPIINDFPYEIDDFGDLLVDDYNKVLPKVRQWIGKNKTSYTLNTEIY